MKLLYRLSVLLFVVLLFPSLANACGGTLHIFMSETAMGYVEDPELKELLEANRKILLWASWYPDSGYVRGNEYGEYSHWTGFQDGYFDYIKNEIGPGNGDYEKLVAHYMGAFAHGMEDQVFDHIFLIKTGEEDGTGQAELDRGLDMVCMDEHRRYEKLLFIDGIATSPGKYTPIEHLEKVYDRLGAGYDNIGSKIFRGQKYLARAILGEKLVFPIEAPGVREISPWGSANYYDAPGGVVFNGKIVAALWDDLWRRFRGRPEKFLIATFPADGGQLISRSRETVDSNIVLFFSSSYDRETINSETFIVEDETGAKIDGSFNWGYGSNMVRFIPARDYRPGKKYKATVTTGIRAKSGVKMPESYTFSFNAPQ